RRGRRAQGLRAPTRAGRCRPRSIRPRLPTPRPSVATAPLSGRRRSRGSPREGYSDLTAPSVVTIIRRLTPMLLPRPILVPTALVGGALAAWIVTYQRMHGMDAGPGTDLGGLGWDLRIWVTITAAMMLPSAMPMVVAFNRVSAERARRETAPALPTWVFVAGYLVAWTAYGVAAYVLYRAAKDAAPHFFAWSSGGQFVAAGALLLAGLYELAPLKDVCLRRCRTPLHFVVHGWRNGPVAPLR